MDQYAFLPTGVILRARQMVSSMVLRKYMVTEPILYVLFVMVGA